jgi:hypothetical protein
MWTCQPPYLLYFVSLTCIFPPRSSVFRAYYIILAHRKTSSGLVVRSASTRLTRSSSRVFIGSLPPPTPMMIMTMLNLCHHLPLSLPTSTRQKLPSQARRCVCGSCSVLKLPRWPSHAHLLGLPNFFHHIRPRSIFYPTYMYMPSLCLPPRRISSRILHASSPK